MWFLCNLWTKIQIKIPFEIQFLGSWEEAICLWFFLSLWLHPLAILVEIVWNYFILFWKYFFSGASSSATPSSSSHRSSPTMMKMMSPSGPRTSTISAPRNTVSSRFSSSFAPNHSSSPFSSSLLNSPHLLTPPFPRRVLQVVDERLGGASLRETLLRGGPAQVQGVPLHPQARPLREQQQSAVPRLSLCGNLLIHFLNVESYFLLSWFWA